MRPVAVALLLLPLLLSACDMPRDAAGTLERVRGGEIRVGVVGHPPWVRLSEGHVEGIEPALVRSFAESLAARIRWVAGSEAQLVEALHRREIDLLAGGLARNTPHSPRLGLTQPYLTASLTIGVPPGQAAPGDWLGRRVLVPSDRPGLIGRLRETGAIPVAPAAEAEQDGPPLPRAGYHFELEAHGLRPVPDAELATERHALAVSGGESAFLLALDRFLHDLGEDHIRRIAAREGGGL